MCTGAPGSYLTPLRWSRAQFPGDCHCSLIKVGLFHRQSEVCEGASERPDERTDSSGEKLLPLFVALFRIPTSTPLQLLHLPLSRSVSLFGSACRPRRHLVSHYSQNSFLAQCQRRFLFLFPSSLLSCTLLCLRCLLLLCVSIL